MSCCGAVNAVDPPPPAAADIVIVAGGGSTPCMNLVAAEVEWRVYTQYGRWVRATACGNIVVRV